MTESEDIKFVKHDSDTVCFVNANKMPDKITRSKIFRYSNDESFGTAKQRFFELCEYHYLYENQIWYSVKVWEEIAVQPWKRALFTLACDAMKGL